MLFTTWNSLLSPRSAASVGGAGQQVQSTASIIELGATFAEQSTCYYVSLYVRHRITTSTRSQEAPQRSTDETYRRTFPKSANRFLRFLFFRFANEKTKDRELNCLPIIPVGVAVVVTLFPTGTRFAFAADAMVQDSAATRTARGDILGR